MGEAMPFRWSGARREGHQRAPVFKFALVSSVLLFSALNSFYLKAIPVTGPSLVIVWFCPFLSLCAHDVPMERILSAHIFRTAFLVASNRGLQHCFSHWRRLKILAQCPTSSA
jgi:hypothetical protein